MSESPPILDIAGFLIDAEIVGGRWHYVAYGPSWCVPVWSKTSWWSRKAAILGAQIDFIYDLSAAHHA